MAEISQGLKDWKSAKADEILGYMDSFFDPRSEVYKRMKRTLVKLSTRDLSNMYIMLMTSNKKETD